MKELTPTQQQVWDIVKFARRGAELTGKAVADMSGFKPRQSGKEGADMRSVINALRCKGYPVCASGKGYYAATTLDEIAEYCASLEGRIAEQESALEGLRNAQPVFEMQVQEGVMEL